VAAAGNAPLLVGLKHDSWSAESGAPSRINSITQSADGFLWIGGVEGLFRFDGVTFDPIRLSSPDSDRIVVSEVANARSGDLWVGLARGRGVAVYRNGQLIDAEMPNPSREVNDIKEDPEGGIWIARGGRSDNTLARYWQGHWQEFGNELNLPAQPVWNMLFARGGTHWIVLSNNLAYRRPGQSQFTTTKITLSGRGSIAEDPNGRLWVSDSLGTRQIEDIGGTIEPHASNFFAHPDRLGGTRMLFDHDGHLWETTWNNGILRIVTSSASDGRNTDNSSPPFAQFTTASGLTSDQARALFQDREGNIWVGTELGLDKLRPANVVIEPGIPANSPTSYYMAASNDGIIYIADAAALYAIRPGQTPERILNLDTLPEALCTDRQKGVWVILADRVLAVDLYAVRNFGKPIHTTAYGCAHDHDGRLWMPALDRGLFWFTQGQWQKWPDTNGQTALPANATLDTDARAVILFRGTPPVEETLPFRPVPAMDPRVGNVEGLLVANTGVLVSGIKGLTPAFSNADLILAAKDHPWAASINGLVQTKSGDTWAIGDAGIIRLRSDDLDAALQNTISAPTYRIFNFHDGLNSFAQKAPGAQVAEGGDGRIWFLTRRNVVKIDPDHLHTNALAPPVVIKAVLENGVSHDRPTHLELRPGTTAIKILYSALSLTAPDRVQLRYRLLGFDDNWVDPGAQRDVVFTGLGPGEYRFEVKASNNDGVWNETGASLKIHIQELIYETLVFKIVCVLVIILALRLLYVIRLRQIAGRIKERYEERTFERERIARELHDSILQNVQGLILRFQSVANQLNDRPHEQSLMVSALDRAEAALVEGRDRLQGLRRSGNLDLERELARLVADQPFESKTQVSVTSHGTKREMASDVFDEIVCITGEALFNAARHAKADEVIVRIEYSWQRLEIWVRDDGIGIMPDILENGGRAGRYGLLGMRERIKRINAKMTINSRMGGGTSVHIQIPAAIAYAKAR
jgi:signal transduction histidine kinase